MVYGQYYNEIALVRGVDINGLYRAAKNQPCGRNYLMLWLCLHEGLSHRRAAYVCQLDEVYSARYGRRGMKGAAV